MTKALTVCIALLVTFSAVLIHLSSPSAVASVPAGTLIALVTVYLISVLLIFAAVPAPIPSLSTSRGAAPVKMPAGNIISMNLIVPVVNILKTMS
jgi:hypothetical protein